LQIGDPKLTAWYTKNSATPIARCGSGLKRFMCNIISHSRIPTTIREAQRDIADTKGRAISLMRCRTGKLCVSGMLSPSLQGLVVWQYGAIAVADEVKVSPLRLG
jgi:hypothetical protein